MDRRRLVIHNRLEDKRLEFYPHQIDHDSIVVYGHTGSITFDAIRWLMKHGINLTILNWNGNLLGVTLPQGPKSGRLRIMQYKTYLDGNKRFAIASEIVKEKIAQTKNLLAELARYYEEVDFTEVERMYIAEASNFSNGVQSIDNLLNYEGRIAISYWNVLAKIFNKLQPDFHFVKRGSKSYSWNMNASDEVNALLNYGYAILESEIRKDVNSIGLDPAVGFLHEIAQSKTPLVYDLQELFRWLVDLSVLQLLEEKNLKKSDFVVTENYHLRLKAATAKTLIERISLNFNKATSYKGRHHTYQNILFDNVQHLANFITGKDKLLRLNIPYARFTRNDPLILQHLIQTMSPLERKKLGIGKSTLWYQKKKVEEGKKIKVYAKTLQKLDNKKHPIY